MYLKVIHLSFLLRIFIIKNNIFQFLPLQKKSKKGKSKKGKKDKKSKGKSKSSKSKKKGGKSKISKKDKKSNKSKNKSEVSKAKNKKEPKETILKKITLANFKCPLHPVNWSNKTNDFYWTIHPKVGDTAIAVEGNLRVTRFRYLLF